MKIDNKVYARYNRLIKDGYYIRPEVYKDGTIYGITKYEHPVNSLAYAGRTIYGYVNKKTALNMVALFGFKVKCETKYFGNAPYSIEDNHILQWYANDSVDNLLD